MKKDFVIVLGMGRSGTSFFAHWLYESGIDMGDDLRPADAQLNANGFYEDIEATKILQHIRHKSNSLYDTFMVNDVKWFFNKKDSMNVEELLLKKNKKQKWGLKEPAMTFVWDKLWIPALKKTNLIDKMILVGLFRDFEKCVQSNMRASLLSKTNILKQLHFRLFKNKYANRYLKEWIFCNQQLIKYIENHENKGNWILMDTNYLLTNTSAVYDFLQVQHKLGIKEINPSTIFDKSLLDRNINVKYKFKPDLYSEAMKVFDKLVKIKETQLMP